MITKKLYTNVFCADAVYSLLQVLKRMGWAYDGPDERGIVVVNVPTEDISLFEFLEECFQC